MPSNTFLMETETASCGDIPDIMQGVQKRRIQNRAMLNWLKMQYQV